MELRVELLLEIRTHLETLETPVVISGNFGPRGDGYRADARMTARDAELAHVLRQVAQTCETLAERVRCAICRDMTLPFRL